MIKLQCLVIVALVYCQLLVASNAATICTVTTRSDQPDYGGSYKTLRACIQQAMAAGGDWNIGFDIQDGISTSDSHVIELERQNFATPSEIGDWSDAGGIDTRVQIGYRIYENPAKPALKITINGTTQTLSTLDNGRPSNAKRITIQPQSLTGVLIFAQIGLKGSISTGGGVLVFAGLRIANFGSAKWDKGLNEKFGGFLHQTNAPKTTIVDCELESIPYTIWAGEAKTNSAGGHYITVDNTRAVDVGFVFSSTYSGTITISNSQIQGPAMCAEGHALFSKCKYATIDIQGPHAHRVTISDTVVSRGYIGVKSLSNVDITCQPTPEKSECGFHDHIKGDGNGAIGGQGVYIYGSNSQNSRLRNVICQGNAYSGIWLLQTRNVQLIDVACTSNEFGIIGIASSYNISGGSYSNNEAGIRDDQATDTVFISGTVVENNQVVGIETSKGGSPLYISKSHIHFNKQVGLYLQDRDSNVVSECYVRNNGVGGKHPGGANIIITSGHGTIISKCRVGINEKGLCSDTELHPKDSVIIGPRSTGVKIVQTTIACGKGIGGSTALYVAGTDASISGVIIGTAQDVRDGKVGRWKTHTQWDRDVSGFYYGIYLDKNSNGNTVTGTITHPSVVVSAYYGIAVHGHKNHVAAHVGVIPSAAIPAGSNAQDSYRYTERVSSNTYGIVVGTVGQASTETTIGTVTGSSFEVGCVVTGNSLAGILITEDAKDTKVGGCIVGLSPDGQKVFSNSGNGFDPSSSEGGITVDKGAVGTVLGSNPDFATVVGGNMFSDCIKVLAAETKIYHVTAGLTVDRKYGVGGEKHGIRIGFTGEGTIIGAKEPNMFPIVGGNRFDGIHVDADDVTIHAAMVGIVDREGTVIGNGASGIFASHRSGNTNPTTCESKSLTIDGMDESGDPMKSWVVVGGNGWDCEAAAGDGCSAGSVDVEFCGAGIQVNSRNAVVRGCQVGIVSNSTQTGWLDPTANCIRPSSSPGVFMNDSNLQFPMWPLSFTKPEYQRQVVAAGAFYSFPNTIHGSVAFTDVYCANDAEAGIRFNEDGYYSTVKDNVVGQTGSRCLLNSADRDCEGDGIHLEPNYEEQYKGAGWPECLQGNVKCGKDEDVSCDSSTVEHNWIIGSQRYGIYVRADHASFGTHGNRIEGTNRRGVRVYLDVTNKTSADGYKSLRAYSTFQSHELKQGSKLNANLAVEDPGNSVVMKACDFCKCMATAEGMSVDCSNLYIGADQINQLEAGTAYFFARNCEMETFPWEVLLEVRATLKVLDLGENPELSPIPSCDTCANGTFADFYNLQVLNLEGTNLSAATNNTFSAISPHVKEIDITTLASDPSSTVVLNMTGATEYLGALAWYDVHRCPPGYFGAIEPVVDGALSGQSLCMRCPTGTQQLSSGVFQSDNNPCMSCDTVGRGYVDDDRDPSTRCILPPAELQFQLNTSAACNTALERMQKYANEYLALYLDETYELPQLLGGDSGCEAGTAFKNYFDTNTRSDVVNGSESISFVYNGTCPGEACFVNTEDGRMLIVPTEIGSFDLELHAVDGAGATETVVTWSFAVEARQDFAVSSNLIAALNTNVATSCMDTSGITCYTRQPLRWELPLNASRDVLFENEGGAADGSNISFIAQQTKGDGSLVYVADEVTGEMFVYATIGGTYEVAIIALNRYSDVAGKVFSHSVAVKTLSFSVEVTAAMALRNSTCGTARKDALQELLTLQFNQPRRDINTSLVIEAFVDDNCTVNDMFSNVGQDQQGNAEVLFRMVVSDSSLSRRTRETAQRSTLGDSDLINTETGQISASLSNVGKYNLELVAQTLGQDSALSLASWTMDVRELDTATESNGPNGLGCANGGVPFDEVAQDDNFTCSCFDFVGANCDTAPVLLLSASDDGTTIIVAGPLGGMCVLLLLLAIVYRIQLYRVNKKAIDVGAIQEKMLHELGLSTPLDIGPHEFGLTIHFANLELIRNLSQASGDRLEFEAKVVLMLKTQRPSLQGVLNLARVNISDVGNEVLIVIPKPQGLKQGFEEQTVAVLKKQAGRNTLLVNGIMASDVSLAVPKRIPREILRTCLLRLEPLGVGNFATVDKYQVSEVARGTPMYFSAVKSVKPGADTNRDALLKEAAMMALLDHRHIIGLIGVCSAPRDMPALLMLEFCENGTLEDYLVETIDENVDSAVQLTFCADICRGLEYISNRRVVHRDIAARNVLLDSTLTCKVSDFGMSTVLPHGEQFVTLHEPIPVRWAAPEVLIDEKFSVMSDVFSFGVLMYELFSCAKTPYTNIEDVQQVAKFVRGGGTCKRPETCPSEIYDKLVMPCFEFNPDDRPTFVEIHDIAIDLGGLDEAHDAGMKADHLRNTASSMEDTLSDEEKLKLLGPSVHHLNTKFRLGIIDAMNAKLGSVFHDWEKTIPVKSANEATIRHMVDVFGKPSGEHATCPRDGEMGAAYVDILKSKDDVGVATALLSYTWGYNVFDVIDTLVNWADQVKYVRDKKRTYIWICSLCLNQHRILHTVVTPEQLAIEFGTRVLSIGRILPMLEPWHSPSYMTRVWCLFELFTAIKNRRHIAIEIILPPNERRAFKKAVAEEGERVIDDALQGVRAENATASVPADEQAIKALITSYQGGFRSLNSTVVHYMHDWFVTMGATKVATRLVNRTPTTSAGSTRTSIANSGPRSDSGGSLYKVKLSSRPDSGKDLYQKAKHEKKPKHMKKVTSADYIEIHDDDAIDEEPDFEETGFGFGGTEEDFMSEKGIDQSGVEF